MKQQILGAPDESHREAIFGLNVRLENMYTLVVKDRGGNDEENTKHTFKWSRLSDDVSRTFMWRSSLCTNVASPRHFPRHRHNCPFPCSVKII